MHCIHEEKLVPVLVSEANNLVFDGRAITRADTFDVSAKHCGAMQRSAYDLMSAFIRVCKMAADLAGVFRPVADE